MTRQLRLFVTVVMVLGGCSSPVRKARDGAASDARATAAPPDAASPAPPDAATAAPPDAASPAPLDAATLAPSDAPTPAPLDAPAPAPLDAPTPAPLDAPAPAPLDAPAPALPDTGVRGKGVVPVAISAGLFSTCALFSDGSVKCWGYNGYGQLGNGTKTDSVTPVAVQGLDNAIALSASDGYHACAVRADRTVVCWGSDYLGALGDGSTVDSAFIKTVLNLSNAVEVSTGGDSSCARLLDQTARCWGSPPGGAEVPLRGVASIQVGGDFACALLTDGTVHCWGNNTSGQIGNGTFGGFMQSVTPPAEVKGLGQVVALSVGYSTVCAVLADHTAVCWGSNGHGQLGNGTVTTGEPYGSALPVPVSDLSNVVSIAAGANYACALLADGTVRCWGSNQDGTLGNGREADSATPVPVSGLTDIVAITTGTDHACALAGDGTIWCWGLNLDNQLGNADTHDTCQGAPCARTPVRIEWKTNSDGGPPPDALTDLPPSTDAGQVCRVGSDCAGLGGTFCQKDSCDPSALGLCTPIPTYCPGKGDMVCGCDGQVYDFPCLAHARAVNIASTGACPLPDAGGPCASNADCESRFYCKKATCTAAAGVCTARPALEVCYDQLWHSDAGGPSVCGCDHVTRSNDCIAAAYGINVDFAGECPAWPSGPCTSQADCGGESYSALVFCRPTVCGQPASGQCTVVSSMCANSEPAVCGCDGQIYGNECKAREARVGWYARDGGCH